jgi:2-acylglycerol O-acyltransferase 2
LFIKQRKGFIKYALKYGYTVRPVIITNEHKAMQTLDIFTKLRLLINKIKIPSVIYWNIKFGILFPPGVVMNTIVGKGVKGSKIYGKEEPTHQEINQMHAQYIEEVKRMYEKNKSKNGNTPLTIY